MPTEHSTIQDPQIHEPKGLATANVGEVYVADAGPTGSWLRLPVSSIDTAGATAEQVLIADGAGGASFKDRSNIHGEMLVTGYTTPFAVPAAIDTTLATDSDYIKITAASMWQAGHLHGITFNVDELVVPVAGHYEIAFWASLEISATSTLVGIKYSINDTTPYSTRKLLTKSKTTTDINNIFGTSIGVPLNAGDTISVYIAADGATNVTGREAGLTIKLIGDL